MYDTNMLLIKAIEKFPCLYNYNLPEYLKKDVTDTAWQEVASQTQLSVGECKEKWKNLRYGLLRSLRLNPDGTFKKKYYLHDEMEFVLPYIRSSKHHEVVLQQVEVETDEEANVFTDQDKESSLLGQYQEEEIIPEPPKKKSKNRDSKSNNNNPVYDDSRKMFLLGLLPEVNALTESQMKVFRRKILSLLDDIADTPNQYEMCLLQWQKDTVEQEAQSSSNDPIKKEPL
uniref:MADF domain-containing protein n=1 Tax=Heliothis virescens TaxID=7102 RepID=A0A2A4J599_HELVI